jgi:glycosyltransferase involved in cell wall biosynthesis
VTREIVPSLRVVAVVPAYNEGDVIHSVVGALIEEGVDVYLLDHGSTDDTLEQASRWLGKGLVRIERFPEESGFPERNEREMVWRDILTRVEQVSNEVEADWFMFSNADEFRESPWPDLSLAEAFGFADSLGYNAVNFELFDFRPVDDDFVPGTDPREHLVHYEDGGDYDALQIKAWKGPAEPGALSASGGHSIRVASRRVCPVNFILRHYPLRGETHGRRKVFGERLPRFAAEERAGGWHVQYDAYAEGDAQFLRDPAELRRWDPHEARAGLLSRASRAVLLGGAVRPPQAPEPGLEEVAGWAGRALGRAVSGGELAGAIEALRSQPVPSGDPDLLRAAARVLGNELRLVGEFRDALEVDERVVRAGRIPGARSTAVLAFAEELARGPELLAAWGETFGGDDDVTLVIAVPSQALDQVAPVLGELAAAAGLDSEDAADLLVQPCDDPAELAGAVAAVYTAGAAPRGAPAAFGPDGLAQLRALAA